MYKELFTSQATNEAMKARITQKIEQISGKVIDSESDADFTKNLLDLCILNKMSESYK